MLVVRCASAVYKAGVDFCRVFCSFRAFGQQLPSWNGRLALRRRIWDLNDFLLSGGRCVSLYTNHEWVDRSLVVKREMRFTKLNELCQGFASMPLFNFEGDKKSMKSAFVFLPQPSIRGPKVDTCFSAGV